MSKDKFITLRFEEAEILMFDLIREQYEKTHLVKLSRASILRTLIEHGYLAFVESELPQHRSAR